MNTPSMLALHREDMEVADWLAMTRTVRGRRPFSVGSTFPLSSPGELDDECSSAINEGLKRSLDRDRMLEKEEEAPPMGEGETTAPVSS